MSIPVGLDALRAELERYGRAPYLLTVDASGRPHAVACGVEWRGGLLVTSVGARSRTNAGEREQVSLLWPPFEPGGYSLIVDAGAALVEGVVELRPTKAVLHRPGPAPVDATSSCGSDCVPLLRP